MNPGKKLLLLVLAATSLGACVIPALAADKYPAPIQAAIDSGLKFEETFQAAGNLKGWILSQGASNNTILYTTQNGEVAVAGVMIDAKGTNLNKQYLEKFAPKPDYERTWEELESSAWVVEGPATKDAKSIIYAFEDANCGFCHLTWKAFGPYIKAGLQVRWIPVAVLGADSMPKATVLLSSTDGNVAIAELHANFGKKLTVIAPVDEALKAKVEANAKIMERWGFGGTPTLLYRDKAGKVRAVVGMPNLSDLPAITGLAEQANTDEALTKYR